MFATGAQFCNNSCDNHEIIWSQLQMFWTSCGSLNVNLYGVQCWTLKDR